MLASNAQRGHLTELVYKRKKGKGNKEEGRKEEEKKKKRKEKKGCCLCRSGLLSQNTTGWATYKYTFISHGPGDWEVQDQGNDRFGVW